MINGKSEVAEYLKTLAKKRNTSKEDRIKFYKITSYMRMLREKGLLLGIPYIKHIEDDIWELRPLKDRILFAYLYNNNFIILSIFVKKTQKTPKNEIEKAKKYLKDYLGRK